MQLQVGSGPWKPRAARTRTDGPRGRPRPQRTDRDLEGTPLKGSQREVNRIVMGAVSGIHEALIEIAREIDQIRSEL